MGKKRSSHCGKCGIRKNKRDFYAVKTSWDGLYAYCKSCCKKLSANRYIKSKKKINLAGKRWRDKNKEYLKEKGKNYYQENREKVLKIMRKKYWSSPDRLEKQRKKNHVRRARANGEMGFFKNKEWEDLLKYYGNKCLSCGTQDNLVADHVIPLVKEGANTIDNIQPLCGSCNSKKHTKIIDYRIGHKK